MTDKLYQEGLELYWTEYYSGAIAKFQEVKSLFPQHSEVDRLLQSSAQAKSEGKDRSTFPFWLVGVVVAVRHTDWSRLNHRHRNRGTGSKEGQTKATSWTNSGQRQGQSTTSTRIFSFTCLPSPSPRLLIRHHPNQNQRHRHRRCPYTVQNAGDQGMTVDLSRTVAISPEFDTAPINYGTIKFVSGALAGKEFPVKPDGEFVGRDSSSAQVVIPDPRISKKHLWIGVRDGRVVIVDQESRNGTFVNDPKSPRVTETPLSPGDTVILGESDVARFEYSN